MSADVDASAPPSGDSEEYPVAIGDVIAGRFRIDRYIGIGAMGLVVEARHLELDDRVAMKFLRKAAKNQPDAVGRFAREARAAARLKSEHVATVIDVGEAADGTPYIVMEYLHGANLDDLLERQGPMPIDRSVELTIQMCEALAEAHSFGIVHRDIKPANIFLAQRSAGTSIAKLLDFGISKAALTGEYTDIKLDAQKTSVIMGTPYYMSPEQVRSTRDVDARADIWSLGVVLFELITGQQVWRAEELGQLVPEIIASSPRRISEAMPSIDPAFDAVLSRALEPEVTRRFQTAAEFAEALLPFAPPAARVNVDRAKSYHQQPGSERSIPLLRQSTRDLGEAGRSSSNVPVPDTSRRTTIAVGAIAAFAVVGMIVLVVPRLLRGSAAPTPAVSATPEIVSPTTTTTTATGTTPAPPTTGASPADPSASATATGAAPPRWGTARPAWNPRAVAAPAGPSKAVTSPASAPTPAPAPAPTPPPAPARPTASGIDNDPWHSRQPKLEDNPFK
ncbi:MAG: serine/threonine-protein kinase [Labilithrix sp.]